MPMLRHEMRRGCIAMVVGLVLYLCTPAFALVSVEPALPSQENSNSAKSEIQVAREIRIRKMVEARHEAQAEAQAKIRPEAPVTSSHREDVYGDAAGASSEMAAGADSSGPAKYIIAGILVAFLAFIIVFMAYSSNVYQKRKSQLGSTVSRSD